MTDHIIRATAAQEHIRAFAVDSTDMVREAREIHHTFPVVTAALGRLLSAGAMIGAMMFLTGQWVKPGVHNVEEFDPDPFMEQLNKQGLPWKEIHDGDLEL